MCRKEEKHRRYRGNSLCVVAKVLSPGRPPGICGVQECAGKDFFAHTLTFICQYHATNAPCLYTYLSSVLYNRSTSEAC